MATKSHKTQFKLESKETKKGRKTKKVVKKPTKKLASHKKSPDRYSFAHLAKLLTSGDRLSMLKAVDRLQGRARVLVELACFSNFQFVRLAAISHLTYDADALVEIAKFCQFSDTRSSALDDLSSNNSSLTEVSCSSLFKDTRGDAVNLISDGAALAEVASKSPHKDSRESAMEKIADNQTALQKVAEDSAYRNMRTQAVSKLSNSASLSSLVISSKHLDVKKSAAARLSDYVDEIDDTDALVELAKFSNNEDTRYLAVGRLSEHPWALRTIVYESKYKDAKSTALMLLSDIVYEIDDPDMLTEVAMLSPYQDCRSIAVERLVGQSSALLSVATKARFKDSRDLALDKLQDDVESLKSVSRLSKYQDTRKKAHKLVSSPEVFEGELSRILG
ncbi:MAG: hypothetical protein ABH983_03475 [Candidatus Micrarchaeota archaeon]|nr:hypothetical protein [Candidatus Micrarchaeota archaeon]MBU1681637.1 hypothetical protein [Candidatus Micrarchaeota archaeon]